MTGPAFFLTLAFPSATSFRYALCFFLRPPSSCALLLPPSSFLFLSLFPLRLPPPPPSHSPSLPPSAPLFFPSPLSLSPQGRAASARALPCYQEGDTWVTGNRGQGRALEGKGEGTETTPLRFESPTVKGELTLVESSFYRVSSGEALVVESEARTQGLGGGEGEGTETTPLHLALSQ